MASLYQVSIAVLLVYTLTSFVSGFYIMDQNLAKHWTGWFNSDDPTVTGDYETVERIREYGNYECSKAVPCESPIGMDVRMAGHRDETAEIWECIHFREEALDQSVGFYCMNEDQPGRGVSQKCLDVCRKYDLMNEEGTDCGKCPDFEVRYSCDTDTTKWKCRGEKPVFSDDGTDVDRLGAEAFDHLNADQQAKLGELSSLLKQLQDLLSTLLE